DLALDLQQPTAQHGHRRHLARNKTETGCITLMQNSSINGGITTADVVWDGFSFDNQSYGRTGRIRPPTHASTAKLVGAAQF
ncbi:hypothetical protein, partial [Pseudovibrio sp. Ad37]|uniref:hypothetical protein n=1 Tax=Pseudovibrio sp. Ad37 TaxID=989422 RepID=UPI0019D3FDA8